MINRNNSIRRSFMLLVAAILLPLSRAEAVSPWELFNASQSCVEYRILGCCDTTCSTALLKHRIPALFVEVTKAPGDSIIGGGVGTALTGTRSADDTTHTYEVRIWNVSGPVHYLLRLQSACFICPLSAAHISQVPTSSSFEGNKCTPGCGFSDQFLANLLNRDNAMPIELVYDSSLDILNWRTGCRDMVKVAALGPAMAAVCGMAGLGGTLSDLTSFGGMASNQISDSLAGIGGLGAENLCVGAWGPLYPRQMRSHTTEMVAAAYAAYRALHIARHALGTTSFDVSMKGVLQPAWPRIGSCYKPGASPFRVERTMSSQSGRYGFFWWVDVACCIPWSEVITGCFTGAAEAVGATGAITAFPSTGSQLGIAGGGLGSVCK